MEVSMRSNRCVLLVEANPERREAIGAWLEDRGFDVTACPGPAGPDYVCIGDRTGSCPLIDASDVVVLDCDLPSERFLEGTAAADLLSLYICSEKPVVAIGGSDIAEVMDDEAVLFMDDGPEGGLVGAVERLLEGS
jgi:CheY-like chemotaxis protein